MKILPYDQSMFPYWQRERCCFQVDVGSTSIQKRKKKCDHKAAFLVDGVKLCQLHAGQAALKHLLEIGEDE